MKGSNNAKLVAAMAVLVVFAAYFLVIRPQQSKADSARADRAKIEQQLTALEAATGVNGSNGSTDAPKTEALRTAIPTQPELSTVIRDLDAVARSVGLDQLNVAPGPLTPNEAGVGGGGYVQLTVTVAGKPSATHDYLDKLAKLPRLVVVSQLGLTVNDQTADASSSTVPGSGTPAAQLQVSLKVFTSTSPTTSKS